MCRRDGPRLARCLVGGSDQRHRGAIAGMGAVGPADGRADPPRVLRIEWEHAARLSRSGPHRDGGLRSRQRGGADRPDHAPRRTSCGAALARDLPGSREHLRDARPSHPRHDDHRRRLVLPDRGSAGDAWRRGAARRDRLARHLRAVPVRGDRPLGLPALIHLGRRARRGGRGRGRAALEADPHAQPRRNARPQRAGALEGRDTAHPGIRVRGGGRGCTGTTSSPGAPSPSTGRAVAPTSTAPRPRRCRTRR